MFMLIFGNPKLCCISWEYLHFFIKDVIVFGTTTKNRSRYALLL